MKSACSITLSSSILLDDDLYQYTLPFNIYYFVVQQYAGRGEYIICDDKIQGTQSRIYRIGGLALSTFCNCLPAWWTNSI